MAKNMVICKRFHGLFLSLVIFFASSISIGADSAEEAPKHSEFLFEIDTNTPLYGVNENVGLPVGVLNKLMTVLVAAQMIESGEIAVTDTVSAPSSVMVKGASIWLEPGDEITIDELLRGVIIGNANDAAVTLRSVIDRHEIDFMAAQEEIVKLLSLSSTSFTNEHGYTEPEKQISSASDLSKIVTALSEYEFSENYFRTKLDYVRDGNAQLVNSNRIVQRSKDAIGYKFGYAKETGYCLAAAKDRDGVRYGVILLGFDDEDKMYARANELLDFGYENFSSIEPQIPIELPQSLPVKGAMVDSVPINVSEPGKIVVHNESKSELKAVIALPDYIYAPAKKDDIVGEIHYYLDDKVIYRLTIHVSEDVNKLSIGNILLILTNSIFNFG
ncbi:MAG: serine hydrolase [Ruminococcus sp.]|nr:serine hydrolase [Ruminococcus sp.]